MSLRAVTPPPVRPVPKSAILPGLLHTILRGEWEPGSRLTEMDLAERFGVSRTPVREALLELEGLGVVELRRNCGAVLRAFGPREVAEIYEVRSILEVEATRHAAGNAPPETLMRLQEMISALRARGEADAGWKLDRELHGAIAAASGNRRLAGEIGRYGNLVQAVRETVGEHLKEIHAVTVGEHLEILDQLIDGDAKKAASAMRAHLDQAAKSAVTAVTALRAT